MIGAIGLAVAGRAGARLANHLGVAIGRDTLLRAVRAIPARPIGEVPVLGIDDFAIRRGHVYGTVVVDMTTSRPIDLLADRTAGTVATWLLEHPSVEVVCRDRAGAYAEGIRIGAPDAVQVADRWHLWHNLAEAVEKTVIRHRADLRLPAADDGSGPTAVVDSPAREAESEQRLVVRTRERYTAVQQLVSKDVSLSAIGRKLSLDRRTVRRFARASEVEELLTTAESRTSLLDEFKPYLHQRFHAGCTDAARLTREIMKLGYRGSDKTVRRYLQPLRDADTALTLPPIAPTIRQVTGWLTRRPDRLTDDDRTQLDALLGRSPALAAIRELVREFAEIMTNRRGYDLGTWMRAIDISEEPALRSFAAGLRRDLDVVTAGLTLPYNSGAVEGHVNRIIMWNLTTRTIMFSSGLTTELRRRYERHGDAGEQVAGAGPACTGDRVAATMDRSRASSPNDRRLRAGTCRVSADVRAGEYLQMCERESADPLTATRAHIGIYVRELTERPSLRGPNVVSIDSGAGLANATTGQRLVSVRLFYDYLMEEGLRDSNPVGRGRYTSGRHGSGNQRGLVPRLTKLPWIPTEQQWADILEVAAAEPVRNRVMLALAYDAALRREELCSLRTDDLDPAHFRPENPGGDDEEPARANCAVLGCDRRAAVGLSRAPGESEQVTWTAVPSRSPAVTMRNR